ncbi:MAG: hypothetical protein WC299_05055 [Kiritimatiellia bacterium]
MQVSLFDPEKKTSSVLESAGFPFKTVDNIDSLASISSGLIMIGEGLSFKDFGGLPETMIKAAAAGIPVLCLAPVGGEMTICGPDVIVPGSMIFRGVDIIRNFDKRLDSNGWPMDGKIQSGLIKLRGTKERVVGEIGKTNGGWPWLEMRYGKSQTRLVVCGFAIMEKWDACPAPRFLLANILEYMAAKDETSAAVIMGGGR